jgi:hypothetical protein
MNRIDLIIDALYKTKLLMDAHGQYPHTLREVDEALAAAHELRALKPVAYLNISGYFYIKVPQSADPSYYTPLYALDKVTK